MFGSMRKRCFITATCILLLAAGFSIAGNQDTSPQLPQPILKGLGNRLAITAEADSWTELCEKVKPAFTWADRDMMWIEEDKPWTPVFKMNRAYLYQPHNAHPAKWVLLEPREGDFDEYYAAVMGNNLSATAKLMDKKPQGDHGSGDYAIWMGSHKNYGDVYEIGWQKLRSNGTSLREEGRRLYVLKQQNGKWKFLGEGPGEYSGKSGGYSGYGRDVVSRVVWPSVGNDSVEIYFTSKDTYLQWKAGENKPGSIRKQTKVMYTDLRLEYKGDRLVKSAQGRPYILIKSGDTLDSVVEMLASWTVGWDVNRPDMRDKISAMWRRELIRLNGLPSLDNLRPGTKLDIVTYPEMINHLGQIDRNTKIPAKTLREKVYDVAVEHIKSSGPDSDTAYLVCWYGNTVWPHREEFVKLVLPFLKSSDPEKVAGALEVMYRLRYYCPMNYIGDFFKDNGPFFEYLDKVVLANRDYYHSVKDEAVYHNLALYLSGVKTQAGREELLRVINDAKDKEQALICLSWRKDPQDMDVLFPYLLEKYSGLAYHFRNSYGKAAIPYLRQATKNSKSPQVRQSAMNELQILEGK